MGLLKFIRAFLNSDTSWSEGQFFEIFMSAVIATNALVMSLELDIAWAMDLWWMPFQHYLQAMQGKKVSEHSGGNMSKIMSLLRLMRIMRVLRLVRLLKAIKPLYRLLLGVIESLKAMQWVMVLTLLMLYAGAIFWTSLVGKGLMYGGTPPPEGIEHFGSVPTSLFSLFRIMNGDTSVVRSVTTTVFGQLMFAAFMVLSNWAILAILTSVVSDNMISASQRASEEDSLKEKVDEKTRRVAMLKALFGEIDKDGSGCIDEEEWQEVCSTEAGLFRELGNVINYGEKELQELFKCLSASKSRLDDVTGNVPSGTNSMYFDDFLEHL